VSKASSSAIQLFWTDDATVTGIPTDQPYGAYTMIALPAIGLILVLIGLGLFLLDLHVTNNGLLTVGGIVALLAGGLALFGAGVPSSGILLGVVVITSMLMGGVLFGILGSLRGLRGRPAITGREGMIGEVGTVRSPVGTRSEGWVFVHGERWRATLAFAPEEAYPEDSEPVLEVGHRAAVVGFGDRGVLQVVPVELPSRRSDLGPRD
jgi:membrane-bound serine protease (ClpP class)